MKSNPLLFDFIYSLNSIGQFRLLPHQLMMNAVRFDRRSLQLWNRNKLVCHHRRYSSYGQFYPSTKCDRVFSIYFRCTCKVHCHRQTHDGMMFYPTMFPPRDFVHCSGLPAKMCNDRFFWWYHLRYFPKLQQNFDHQTLSTPTHFHCSAHTTGWPLLSMPSTICHHLSALAAIVIFQTHKLVGLLWNWHRSSNERYDLNCNKRPVITINAYSKWHWKR